MQKRINDVIKTSILTVSLSILRRDAADKAGSKKPEETRKRNEQSPPKGATSSAS